VELPNFRDMAVWVVSPTRELGLTGAFGRGPQPPLPEGRTHKRRTGDRGLPRTPYSGSPTSVFPDTPTATCVFTVPDETSTDLHVVIRSRRRGGDHLRVRCLPR
jgi:hypothetical protein